MNTADPLGCLALHPLIGLISGRLEPSTCRAEKSGLYGAARGKERGGHCGCQASRALPPCGELAPDRSGSTAPAGPGEWGHKRQACNERSRRDPPVPLCRPLRTDCRQVQEGAYQRTAARAHGAKPLARASAPAWWPMAARLLGGATALPAPGSLKRRGVAQPFGIVRHAFAVGADVRGVLHHVPDRIKRFVRRDELTQVVLVVRSALRHGTPSFPSSSSSPEGPPRARAIKENGTPVSVQGQSQDRME